MKIVAVSDLHGTLPRVPECDLLLVAGDICPVWNHSLLHQASWLNEEFRNWLDSVPARKIIGVAGNHDFIFQTDPEKVPRDLPWTYLQDSAVTWEGLKIHGSPWQPWFFDWAFNLQPDELREKWELIPEDTDILVLHGPPHGFGDLTIGGRRTGCSHLLERIKRVQPHLAVFGHIHEGRGEWTLGKTKLANVTILNERYEHLYEAWEYEFL